MKNKWRSSCSVQTCILKEEIVGMDSFITQNRVLQEPHQL